MYDIDLKNVRKGNGFYGIFLIVGLFFLAALGFVLFKPVITYFSYKGTAPVTEALLNEHNGEEGVMYSPSFVYEVKGSTYVCKTNHSTSMRPKLDNVKVKYDLENPGSCISSYETFDNWFLFIFLAIPIVFIAVGLTNIIKVNKKVKKIKNLNKTGTLVKGLRYTLKRSNETINNRPVLVPVIEYKIPSGSVITLTGDPRYDRKEYDADGLVDMIIDPNDYSNYFIDFEINRLTGNSPSDYYHYDDEKKVY